MSRKPQSLSQRRNVRHSSREPCSACARRWTRGSRQMARYVAFLVNEYVPERPKARPRLWLAPVDGGEAHPVALATGDDRGEDSCPRWSPDSKHIAFLSTREHHPGDTKQIYVTTLDDGEPGEARRVCSLPNGAESLAWSPDGARIRLVALEGAEAGAVTHSSLDRSQPAATAASGPSARKATRRSRSRRRM